MATVLEPLAESLVVHTSPAWELNDEQFFEFCQINSDLRIERSANGDIIIMAPAGGSSSSANAQLTHMGNYWDNVALTMAITTRSSMRVKPPRPLAFDFIGIRSDYHGL